MKKIYLQKAFVALVDDEDYDTLMNYRWYAHKIEGIIYVKTTIPLKTTGKRAFMHRMVTSCPDGFMVDHIDGNGLNNQKFNLRICTHKQNMCNRKSCGRSKYLGVWLDRLGWRVSIKVDGHAIKSRAFHKEEDAALEYNRLAIIYHGEFARLNIITNE